MATRFAVVFDTMELGIENLSEDQEYEMLTLGACEDPEEKIYVIEPTSVRYQEIKDLIDKLGKLLDEVHSIG